MELGTGSKILFGLFATTLVPILLVFVYTTIGAFMGLIISYIPILGDGIKAVLRAIIPSVDIQLWQLGAFLGFIACFFTSLKTPNKEGD